jgi:hypothetical protein
MRIRDKHPRSATLLVSVDYLIIVKTYVFLGRERQAGQAPHSRRRQAWQALQETRAARTFSTRCSRRALFFAFSTELLSYNNMNRMNKLNKLNKKNRTPG